MIPTFAFFFSFLLSEGVKGGDGSEEVGEVIGVREVLRLGSCGGTESCKAVFNGVSERENPAEVKDDQSRVSRLTDRAYHRRKKNLRNSNWWSDSVDIPLEHSH